METGARFSCVIVGEDSLTIKCVEALITRGHSIKAFVSTNPLLRTFSEDYDIPTYDSITTAIPTLAGLKFDYLLSIVNPTIIPQNVLAMPKYFGVNFHPGPLPRYAGLHCTTWALINNEKSHGVTWHVMTATVDAGPILKQTIISIEPSDTALTLNIKCHEEGLLSFYTLIEELQHHSYEPIPQNLTERTYHTASNLLPHDGILNWHSSADEIGRTFRALSLGNHINLIGSPKFLVEGQVFIPQDLRVLEAQSKNLPGSIVNLSSDFIQIATNTKDIAIYKLSDINGHAYTIKQLVWRFDLTLDYRFPPLDKTLAKKVSSFHFKHNAVEAFWVNALSHSEPATIPFFPIKPVNPTEQSPQLLMEHVTINSDILRPFKKSCPPNTPAPLVLITLWLVTLYRLNNNRAVTVAYTDSAREQAVNVISPFYTPQIPLTIKLQDHLTYREAFLMVIRQLQLLMKKGFAAKDLAVRYPALSDNNHIAPIALCVTNHIHNYTPEPTNSVTIAINKQGTEFGIFVRNNHKSAFQTATIHALPSQFETLTTAIANNMQHPIGKLPLLTSSAAKALLSTQQNTAHHVDIPNCFQTVFHQVVNKHPQKIAVHYQSKTLTYLALNQKANQLANILLEANVQPGQHIAICLQRSIDAIVSILATLKVGATFVPIDMAQSIPAVTHILTDCDAKLVITRSDLTHLIPNANRLITLDTSESNLTHASTQNPQCRYHGTDSAYVIYTSGSHGTPKGVRVTQASLMNSLAARLEAYQDPIRLLFTLNIAFDTSTAAIFWPLICGGEVIISPQHDKQQTTELATLIKSHQATHFICVPSFYNSLLNQHPESLRTLSTVILGGESWGTPLRQLHQYHLPHCDLFNEYGQTETSVWVASKKVYDAETKSCFHIDIGTPCKNTHLYILDKNNNLAPVGVLGELCVSGQQLAAGYLNLPEITAQRFVDNPFEQQHSQLYKTGDLARWLPDGNIEFISRIDDQIKLRGYRIEPSAIRTLLLTHKKISQCCITLQADSNRQQHLIAFIILTTKQKRPHTLTKELAKYLSQHLPDYMIPSCFIELTAFPYTPNGKIDLDALPRATEFERSESRQFSAPVTPMEKRLAIIWSDLLHVQDISIDDNFFTLGGHSLLITRMVLRIKEHFNLSIPIHNFFDNPTISNLAKLLDKQHRSEEAKAANIHWNSEIKLDVNVQVMGIAPAVQRKPKAILLTGGTGFLGAHLLSDLYRHTNATIYCLLRSSRTPENGIVRLRCSLNQYNLDNAILESGRIIACPGDLSFPLMGLSHERFNELADIIETIYHSAAKVHHLYNYDVMKSTNVQSTQELLRFATTRRLKRFHYISTISAAVDKNLNGHIAEQLQQGNCYQQELPNGYVQSKWVSERLIANADMRDVPVNVYRPTWITGSSNTGIAPTRNNHLFAVIKGCIQLGAAPDWDIRINMMPVDVLSKIVTEISLQQYNPETVFNLANTHEIDWLEFMRWLKRYGYHINIIPAKQWRMEYLANAKSDNAIYPLLPLYMSESLDNKTRIQNTPFPVAIEHTQSAMAELNIAYPKIDEALLEKYFHYFHESDFIKAPQAEMAI